MQNYSTYSGYSFIDGTSGNAATPPINFASNELVIAETNNNSTNLKKSLLNLAAALVDKYSYEPASEYFNKLLKILSPNNPVLVFSIQ